MRPKTLLAPAAFLLLASLAVRLGAQGRAAANASCRARRRRGPRRAARRGGPPQGGEAVARRRFPAQQRPPGDPAAIARGKGLYGVNCRACHGADLRGGDMGGPNLLRSQLVLNDQDGELILPVVQNGRQNPGHAGRCRRCRLPPDDVKAIAAYIHSVAGDDARPGLAACRRRRSS